MIENTLLQQSKWFFTRPQLCSFASRMCISGVFRQKTKDYSCAATGHWQVKGRCIFTRREPSGPQRFMSNSRLVPHIWRWQQSLSSNAYG